MAFHHDFWVTVGTVAPVIGIGHAAATGRYMTRVVGGYEAHKSAILQLRRTTDRAKQSLADLSARDDEMRARTQRLGEQVTEGQLAWLTKGDATWRPTVVKGLDQMKRDLDRWDEDSAALRKVESELDRRVQYLEARDPMLRRAGRWATAADVVTAFGWALCVFALAMALVSLANEHDTFPPTLGAVNTLLAMSLVLVTPIVDATRWARSLGTTEDDIGTGD